MIIFTKNFYKNIFSFHKGNFKHFKIIIIKTSHWNSSYSFNFGTLWNGKESTGYKLKQSKRILQPRVTKYYVSSTTISIKLTVENLWHRFELQLDGEIAIKKH